MAVFDGREKNRYFLDDLQTLSCLIEAAENVQGHTVYIIKVHRGPTSEVSWQITRRYSDFDCLNNLLLCSGLDLPLPPKKVFGKLEREFIAERQQGLQAYMNYLLNHPFLSGSLHVKRFLDPLNYSINFIETSLQHVSMVFRSEPEWEIVEPLSDFGGRIRKQYFFIKSKNQPKKRFVLSWMTFGTDKYLNEKDLTSVIKLIGSLQHPYIYALTMSCVSDNGGLVIYDFLENGTLRDFLCKAKPNNQFLKKYGNPKTFNTLELKKVQLYGYQVLIALKFLHDKGLYHGHLHSGNVILADGRCKLLDIANSVLGLSCFLRPYYLQIKRVQTIESIDVYCFGHLLYEMAFNSPLHTTNCDIFPSNCSPELRSVLEAILTKEACRNGLPSISDLLQHPFFRNLSGSDEKIHFKVPMQLKESLKKAKEQVEQHLKEEQKAIRHSKRLSKVQAQLTSEEEKKKRSERKKLQKINLDLQNSVGSEKSITPTPAGETPDVDTPSSQPSVPPPFIPPPPPPPPPPPLPSPVPISNMSNGSPSPSTPITELPSSGGRTALLSSIQGFNKSKLKKSETVDKTVLKV